MFTPAAIVCTVVLAPAPATVTRETLPSGVHLIVSSRPKAPVTAIEIRVRGAGSGSESDAENGLAHIVEHLVFKGTADKQPGMLDHIFEGMGGEATAQTLRDGTAYRVTVLPDKWDDCLHTMVEMVTKPAFRDADWQMERPVILHELAIAQGDTNRIGVQTLSSVAYPKGDPYQHAIMGPSANVTGFTTDTIRAFHAKWYRPENLTIVVSGDVQATAVKVVLSELFPATADPAAVAPPAPTDAGEPDSIQRAPFLPANEQTARSLATVFLGFRAPRISTDPNGAAAADLLTMILARGNDSILGQKLLGSKILDVVAVSSDYLPQARRALFVVSATGDKRDIGRIEDAMVKNIDDLTIQFLAGDDKDGTLEDMLDAAKSAAIGTERGRRETVEGEAQYLAQLDMVNAPADYSEKYAERIHAVTISDIARLLSRYMDTKKRSVALVGLSSDSVPATFVGESATP